MINRDYELEGYLLREFDWIHIHFNKRLGEYNFTIKVGEALSPEFPMTDDCADQAVQWREEREAEIALRNNIKSLVAAREAVDKEAFHKLNFLKVLAYIQHQFKIDTLVALSAAMPIRAPRRAVFAPYSAEEHRLMEKFVKEVK